MFFSKKEKKNTDDIVKDEKAPVPDELEVKEEGFDNCIVSNMISIEGWKVGYMFRQTPSKKYPDSGWRFFKGDETEEYINTLGNTRASTLGEVSEYDPDIIPYLDSPVGSYLLRVSPNKFEVDDDDNKAVLMMMQEKPKENKTEQ